jgi:hypothetical protein
MFVFYMSLQEHTTTASVSGAGHERISRLMCRACFQIGILAHLTCT